MRSIAELVLAWVASTSEKERAQVEHEMRAFTPDTPGARKNYCGYWITAQLPPGSENAGPRHIMDRAILHRVGAAAEPIWAALEAKKVTLRSSGIIIARSRDDKQQPTPEKVEATIQAYLAGTLDKKRPSENAPTSKTRARTPEKEPEEPLSARGQSTEFFAAVERLFDQMLVGVPEFAAYNIRAVGRADLRALTETWRSIIARARVADPEKLSDASRTKRLYAALRVLNVDPPKNGEFTPKVRANIKTQFRRLARLYHPDRTQNNPALAEEYLKVVEANACVQALLSPDQTSLSQSQKP
jgi:hypothetical protein